MADIEDDWESFFNDDNTEESAPDTNEQRNNIIPENFEPSCSDINISTKTKIVYLNTRLDLDDLFWKIDIIPYDTHNCGVIKKQIKFNFNTKEQVQEFEEKIKKEKFVNMKILNQIDNPNGRVQFKDVRKINIGYSKNDIIKNKKSSKSAFYNCIVIIFRTVIQNKFKEIHIKIFNSGKLEIPGIQSDEFLYESIRIIKQLIGNLTNKDVDEIREKRETVLVNSNFTCNYYINRNMLFNILKNKYNIKCNYDSCSYPGIQCKYKKNSQEISFMIFRTGSVLIVGKCEDDLLFEIYEFLKKMFVDEYLEIYEQNSENDIKKTKVRTKVKKSYTITKYC